MTVVTATERTVKGNVAERTVRVRCEECLEDYDVVLRAFGSARGRSEDGSDLAAKAARAAASNLEQLAPMDPCPRCGMLQPEMVERMFHEPLHLSAQRRYDQTREAVNSPWARAVRLRSRGMAVDDIGKLIGVAAEVEPAWRALLAALATDETWTARGGALAARLASFSEGARLAYYLVKRRRMTPPAAEPLLASVYGLPPARARALCRQVTGDRARIEGSLGLVTVGLLLLFVGGLLAFILGVAVPFIKAAINPPAPEPDLRMSWPTPVHYSVPRDRSVMGDEHPVPLLTPRGTEGVPPEPRPPGRPRPTPAR